MLKVKLYGRANNVTLDSNNFATVTDLTGADVYEMNCYFINANNEKLSEAREIAGGIMIDAKTYRKGFRLVSERYLLADFGANMVSLQTVLNNNYLYIEVIDYAFTLHGTGKCIPFEVMSYSESEASGGRKWFELGLRYKYGTS